jgi:NADH-quinone oxidoreductase subunit C
MKVDLENILSSLKAALPSARISLHLNPGPAAQHSLLVDGDCLVEICLYLRDELDFDFLSNVTGVDWPDPAKVKLVATCDSAEEKESAGFLEVIYHLYSTRKRVGPLVLRARTKNRKDEVSIHSVVSVYRSAEFQEREIFDLYGVDFKGHPDLRRILMWDKFVDHPMRKDYVAPDDYEYESTPHDKVLELAKMHYPK